MVRIDWQGDREQKLYERKNDRHQKSRSMNDYFPPKWVPM
jgi:hypothetical protein